MIDMNTKPLCCPLCGGLPQSHTSVPLHYFCNNEKCELYMIHVWHERWNRRLVLLEKVQRLELDLDEPFFEVDPKGKYVTYDDVEARLRELP